MRGGGAGREDRCRDRRGGREFGGARGYQRGFAMPACARGNGVDEVFSAFAVSVPSSGDCFFLYGVKWRRAERKEANSGSASENPKALRGLPKPASLLSTRLPDMGWREEAHQQSNAYPLSLSRQISLQPTHLVRPETTPYRGWSLFLLPGRPRADFGLGTGLGFFLGEHGINDALGD